MKKTQRYGLLMLCVLGLLCFSVQFTSSQIEVFPKNENNFSSEAPIVAFTTNDQFIDSLLDNAIADYSSNGYFSSYYQPTLQATYQALSILHSIGGLSQVNETKISSYIIDHYTTDNGSFVDKVALRYIDGDFSQQYYPLQTHMETTCYAVLSLEILDQLDSIDVQEVRDFIWSVL